MCKVFNFCEFKKSKIQKQKTKEKVSRELDEKLLKLIEETRSIRKGSLKPN